MAAGSANTINCYVDRDIDALMQPHPATARWPRQAISPAAALRFGIVLGVAATCCSASLVNWLSAVLADGAIAFYVFVYTLGLKRRTPSNIVIGGAAGCFPVLDRLVRGDRKSWAGRPWCCSRVVFLWTPPHFWALAMRFKDDYAAAGVPMLPVVAAPRPWSPADRLLLWAMVGASLLLLPVGSTAGSTSSPRSSLGAVFLGEAHRLQRPGRSRRDAEAHAVVPPLDHLPHLAVRCARGEPAGVTLADRVAAAYAEAMWTYADGAPGRFAERVAGLRVVSLGLPEHWANTVLALTEPPAPAAVEVALRRLTESGLTGRVLVRERDAAGLGRLERVDEMLAFVGPAAATQDTLQVSPAATAAEFTDVYGAAFAMRPGLASALVVEADLAAERTVHLVGRVDGLAVACAVLRPIDGLGYLSAVGVLPAYQGRGFGTAMLAAGAAEAGARGCDVLWLHATAHTRAFYEGLDFELIDTHVALA